MSEKLIAEVHFDLRPFRNPNQVCFIKKEPINFDFFAQIITNSIEAWLGMVWNLNFQKIQIMTVILSGVIPVGNGRKSVILYQKDFMSAFSYTVRNEFDEKD